MASCLFAYLSGSLAENNITRIDTNPLLIDLQYYEVGLTPLSFGNVAS